jgi:hypothetical protein
MREFSTVKAAMRRRDTLKIKQDERLSVAPEGTAAGKRPAKIGGARRSTRDIVAK